MKVTAQLLIDAVGCTTDRAYLFATHLDDACDSYAINTPERAALFFAHAGHESESLSELSESLNYGAGRLVAVFGAHRITQEQANKYGRKPGQQANQEAIANIVYGGDWGRINLGNVSHGDGWKYRARGIGGITGLANYQAATSRLVAKFSGSVPNFVDEPEALEHPRWASLSFADFWNSRGLNALADIGTDDAFRESCRLINGGFNGIDDRRQRWEKAKRAISALAETSQSGEPAYTSAERVEKPAESVQVYPKEVQPYPEQVQPTSQIGRETPEMQGYQALEDALAGDPAEYPPEQPMPIPAIIGALLPSLIESIPKLGALFGSGSEVQQRNVKAAEMALQIAQTAVGATNAQETVERIKSDPQALQKATQAITDNWYQLAEAGGGGIDGARKADAAAVAAGNFWLSPSFWIAIALLPLVYMLVGSLIGLLGTATWSDDVRAGLSGSIISAIIGGLVGYYYGQTTSRNRT